MCLLAINQVEQPKVGHPCDGEHEKVRMRPWMIMPPLFTPTSYLEGRNADVWEIVATRNGAHQCWDIGIMAVVDIVANGKVRVKLTADGLQTEAVAFPMITRITLS